MSSVQLHTGETLAIEAFEPPFAGGDTGMCWWRDVAADLMAGDLRRWLHTLYYVGEIDGERAGYMSCWTPTDTRDVGLVEFVWTAEAHRRKGVATALLRQLRQDFARAGGLALYLCTTNPHAGRLYERLGFRYHVGDGMRYLAPDAEDFDRHYLDDTGPAAVRDTTWADLPRAAVLYNHPEPRWIMKDVLSDGFRDTRHESHFVRTFRGIEGRRGLSRVLETPERRLVGMATVLRRDTFAEQHTGTLSFRVVPAYFGQCADLLAAAVDGCAPLGISRLEALVAEGDRDELRLLEEAGFTQEARLRDRLRVDGGLQDLHVCTRAVPEAQDAPFVAGHYYGGRQDWQRTRIEETEESQ